MKSIAVFSTLSIAALVSAIKSSADACDSCGAPMACTTYRLVCQMVYDERQVTAFRIETDTVVNAAGMWAPSVAEMVGAFVCSIPVDHQHMGQAPP